MKPDWDALGEEFENSKKVLIADVDCTLDKNKKLCESQGVTGYPTLKYYLPGEREGIDYTGERDLETMRKFVKTLGPPCTPKSLNRCSAEDKLALEAGVVHLYGPSAVRKSDSHPRHLVPPRAYIRHDERRTERLLHPHCC